MINTIVSRYVNFSLPQKSGSHERRVCYFLVCPDEPPQPHSAIFVLAQQHSWRKKNIKVNQNLQQLFLQFDLRLPTGICLSFHSCHLNIKSAILTNSNQLITILIFKKVRGKKNCCYKTTSRLVRIWHAKNWERIFLYSNMFISKSTDLTSFPKAMFHLNLIIYSAVKTRLFPVWIPECVHVFHIIFSLTEWIVVNYVKYYLVNCSSIQIESGRNIENFCTSLIYFQSNYHNIPNLMSFPIHANRFCTPEAVSPLH